MAPISAKSGTQADERLMAHRTWLEIRDAAASGAGVILPVGATEQHGPHLPLATDYLCATAVASDANVIVAPPVTYGCPSRPLSGGGQGFVGTTSLTPATFMGVIQDVLAELLRHGFRRFAVLNWHYENGNFLYESVRAAIGDREDVKALVFETCLKELSSETISVVFSGGYMGRAIEHAATYETSIMMYIHPELVRFDRLVDDAAERRPWYDIVPTPSDIVPQSGVLWKVAGATAEKGRLLWDEVIPPVREAILQELG
jgi:creatinine amidohydrolase